MTQGRLRSEENQAAKFINLLHLKEHFSERVKFLTPKMKEKPVGNLITNWTKVKNKAMPIRMLPKTMGPLKEVQLSGDNNHPGNAAHTKYHIIAILLYSPRNCYCSWVAQVCRHGIYISRGNSGKEREGGLYLSLEQIPFYTGWEGKLSFSWNRAPRLKEDRPLQ